MYDVCCVLQELLQNCDNNLRNHQVYRDTYVDMTDWLSSAMDRLAMCSDIRGDRHAIEALQHKVQVEFKILFNFLQWFVTKYDFGTGWV